MPQKNQKSDNSYQQNIKQFTKHVIVRKLNLTILIFKNIDKQKSKLDQKKLCNHSYIIDKLTLFLPKK